MSVLVKDMEMPETCDCCPFHIYYSHYEYVCKATPMLYPMNLANSKGIRKTWCPLSEVPEPCEDAVSRQEALNAMDTWDKFGRDPDGKLVRYDEDNHYVPYVRYDDMVHVIKHLPSVQPDIIYCKDCKHWDGEKRGQFWYFEQCSLNQHTASCDDFCSFAERRTE